jgi:hypothetical protein
MAKQKLNDTLVSFSPPLEKVRLRLFLFQKITGGSIPPALVFFLLALLFLLPKRKRRTLFFSFSPYSTTLSA